MKVVLTPHPGDTQCVFLNIFWQDRIVHVAAFTRTRAASVARLFAEAGYPVLWKASPQSNPEIWNYCHDLDRSYN